MHGKGWPMGYVHLMTGNLCNIFTFLMSISKSMKGKAYIRDCHLQLANKFFSLPNGNCLV